MPEELHHWMMDHKLSDQIELGINGSRCFLLADAFSSEHIREISGLTAKYQSCYLVMQEQGQMVELLVAQFPFAGMYFSQKLSDDNPNLHGGRQFFVGYGLQFCANEIAVNIGGINAHPDQAKVVTEIRGAAIKNLPDLERSLRPTF